MISSTTRRAQWLYRVAFWAACAATGVLSLTPVENLPRQVLDVWDKAQHAAGFAVLAWLGCHAFFPRLRQLAAGLLIYGALIELAQAATGWRQGDVLDWMADSVGLLAGLLLFKLTARVLAGPSRGAK